MSEKYSNTKTEISLFKLKESMEETVFNYIDTTQKWEPAYESLDELVTISIKYFNHHFKANDAALKGDTYRVIFLDIASKLIYFHTISYYHLKGNEKSKIKNEVLELLTMAANCIPDIHKKDSVEFLKEIAASYEEIASTNVKQGEFEKLILAKNNRINDCLETFEQYAEIF